MLVSKEKRLILFIGLSFLFIWSDILLGHASGGMHHPGMWIPLLIIPVGSMISVICFFYSDERIQLILKFFYLIAIPLGCLGFAFHLFCLLPDLKGSIQWEVLARLVRYPPVLAPLSISGLGILGLLITEPSKK